VTRLGLEDSATTRSRCPSQAAFHRFRRALVDVLDLDRAAVRPGSPMAPLISTGGRKAERLRFERALGIPLPSLVRPEALVKGLTIAVAVFRTAGWALGLGMPPPACLLLAAGLALLLGILAGCLTAPFATRSPRPARQSATPWAWSYWATSDRSTTNSTPAQHGPSSGLSLSPSSASALRS
jgi:hypothetical protein